MRGGSGLGFRLLEETRELRKICVRVDVGVSGEWERGGWVE